MASASQTPNWQPISALPQVAWMIDGMLESADEQLGNLHTAQNRPGALDNATLDRLIDVYTRQQNDLPLYTEQLTRWRNSTLDAAQQNEVSRLDVQLAALYDRIVTILALAAQIKPHTIDAILGMSDMELALAVLSGKIPMPGAPNKKPS